jgi:hypothetical protein
MPARLVAWYAKPHASRHDRMTGEEDNLRLATVSIMVLFPISPIPALALGVKTNHWTNAIARIFN